MRASVFTPDQVALLCRTADSVSPRYGLLFHLLFTTGVRIGAVRNLTWLQCGVGHKKKEVPNTIIVREKGGFPRVLILTETVRSRIQVVRETSPSLGPYVFETFLVLPCKKKDNRGMYQASPGGKWLQTLNGSSFTELVVIRMVCLLHRYNLFLKVSCL